MANNRYKRMQRKNTVINRTDPNAGNSQSSSFAKNDIFSLLGRLIRLTHYPTLSLTIDIHSPAILRSFLPLRLLSSYHHHHRYALLVPGQAWRQSHPPTVQMSIPALRPCFQQTRASGLQASLSRLGDCTHRRPFAHFRHGIYAPILAKNLLLAVLLHVKSASPAQTSLQDIPGYILINKLPPKVRQANLVDSRGARNTYTLLSMNHISRRTMTNTQYSA